ncbi:Oidioi.mRNA.OKI2018_I69.chr2.g4886.t1.cds [Oikopleura dioica]|uniref:Oidioi.mRNA.OKI2018_I69.chr2.g4886.t1.cds n=1 Tax=Oikopleura dioica TaxID=34765 RepID=A0ABN7SYF6_OIKDI|nr:Oidioi.mRNA.OKI2018_I69.chr2.g4886.t1.cds [Oikopleura dioica]
MPEFSVLFDFWQRLFDQIDGNKASENDIIALTPARFLLFDSIVAKESTEKIFASLDLYRNVNQMIDSFPQINSMLSGEEKDLFDNFRKLEDELFSLENIEDMTYVPGGYSGLYLAVNMRNKPTRYSHKQVDERLLEELMSVDMDRGTPASHIFVVAAFNHHLDLLTSSFWNKFSIDWNYSIGRHTVFMAPNEFIRRILVNNPYSKEDIYQLVHKMDDTYCILLDQVLETVPCSKVCEIISKPNLVGYTSVFYATRMCYRFTKMLLDRLPELEFNQTCFFGNTVGLIFTPLIGRILERGMNPFIIPRYRRVPENFNFEIKNSMFEKYPELRDIHDQILNQKEKYFLSSQYDVFKKEVHAQADMKKLEQKLVNAAIKAIGEQGLCHRDIKPQNILLKRNEHGILSVKVADFGLSGFSGGTPLYNPPESTTGSIPFASDIYSLGITMLFTLFESDLAFKMYLMPETATNANSYSTFFQGTTEVSKMISRTIHDQFKGDSFKCWAFATASMIRSSLREAILNSRRIDNFEKEELLESIKSIDHKSAQLLRSELMMNVIPTKVHANSEEIQSAMLHHVMRRLTEPTLLQKEGIFMLGCLRGIFKKLEPFEVKLNLFAHPTDYDRFPKSLSESGVVGDFINALEEKKVLVCPVRMGKSSIKHAMCLYGFNEDSDFLFKNTSNETKTIAIPLTKGEPKIGYHICFQETNKRILKKQQLRKSMNFSDLDPCSGNDMAVIDYDFIAKSVISVLGIAAFIGIGGNFFILIVLSYSSSKNPISILLINLAVANIVFQIIVLPCQIAVYWFPYWKLGRVLCRVSFFTEDMASSQLLQDAMMSPIITPFQSRRDSAPKKKQETPQYGRVLSPIDCHSARASPEGPRTPPRLLSIKKTITRTETEVKVYEVQADDLQKYEQILKSDL